MAAHEGRRRAIGRALLIVNSPTERGERYIQLYVHGESKPRMEVSGVEWFYRKFVGESAPRRLGADAWIIFRAYQVTCQAYHDYVIRPFASNKPHKNFVVECIYPLQPCRVLLPLAYHRSAFCYMLHARSE